MFTQTLSHPEQLVVQGLLDVTLLGVPPEEEELPGIGFAGGTVATLWFESNGPVCTILIRFSQRPYGGLSRQSLR